MNAANKQGVILVNLGTPDAPTASAIKRYLREFLSDRLVVDLPAWFWQPLLKGVILPKRAKRISHNYQAIWLDEGSPLRVYSQQLVNKLNQLHPEYHCQLAMTYGTPSLQQALSQLADCQTLRVIPLFPQYSTTTTLPIIQQLKQLKNELQISTPIYLQSDYAAHPAYIMALQHQISQSLQQMPQVDCILLSFHGIPLKYIQQRDEPYIERCQLTVQKLQQQLHASGITVPMQLSFQSRFGGGKWTSPDTTTTLQQLARSGKRNVLVLCPGFAIDCIETLDEIAILNRQHFLAAGGQTFTYLPALNASDAQINLMQQLLQQPITDKQLRQI